MMPLGTAELELKLQREVMIERFKAVDERFKAVDTRFADMQASMDNRFHDMQISMDRRFEDMHRRFNGLQWMIGGGVVLLATMMSLYRFLG